MTLFGQDDLLVEPDFKHTELVLEQRIKSEVLPSIKLDADNQICKEYTSSPTGCPRGAACPLRHTTPSSLNFTAPVIPTTAHGRTVCKHWLRGLCKKGNDCEFMHEYNLRKMPECWFFTKHGFCSSGDECMYLHITQHQRRPECRSYTAGFCRLGPECPNKHIRRVLCPLYAVGFCPDGLSCKLGAHPPFTANMVERMLNLSQSLLRESYKNAGDREWPDAASIGGGGPGFGRDHSSFRDAGGPSGGFGMGGGTSERTVSGDVVLDDRPPMRRGRMRNVTCFKCGQEGHLASVCPNPSVPGNRGGIERGAGGRPIERH